MQKHVHNYVVADNGTPLIELYLLHYCTGEQPRSLGINPARSLVGNYTTALEMAGGWLNVTVLDDEMRGLWDAPVHTAALRW